MVDSSTDLWKQLEKLEKRQKRLGNTGLTGAPGQFCELFFEAMDNGKQSLVLARRLAEELGIERPIEPTQRRKKAPVPRRRADNDLTAP